MRRQLVDRQRAMIAALAERLNALRALSFVELVKLPDMSDEEVVIVNGKKLKFIVWHDEIVPGQHRIVVGSYRPTYWGMVTYIEADGFVVDEKNEKRPLTAEELMPFK